MNTDRKKQILCSRWVRLLSLMLLAVLALGSWALPGAWAASLVTNGDFSNGSTGWSYTGNVYFPSGAVAFSGGNMPVNGVLWQQISTMAGQSYTMDYDMFRIGPGAGTPQALVEVIDTGTGVAITSTMSAGGVGQGVLVHYTLAFVAQGPAMIRFIDQTTNTISLDLGLDNVTVQPPENASGLLGYWKFDEGTGTTAADSSGSNNNGTLSGGAAFSTSAAPITNYADPGSLSVSGATSSLVTVPNSAINRLTNNFTVMGWINPSSISGIQRVIATARTTSGGWGFGLNANWLYFTTYGVKSYLTPLSTGMKTGQWYHIAAVMDSSNAVTFYLDGVFIGTVAHTAPGIADTNDVLQIGAGTTSGSSTLAEPFNGLIDDLQVYDHALSASEVADLVGVPPCSEPVLRARVMLGEKSGTINLDGACTYPLTYADSSSNGGSGIYVSAATVIEGNGAAIERSAGSPQFRLLTTNPAITIRNLTLRGGNVAYNGGALMAFGNTTLANVRFENNVADSSAAAYGGGALYAKGNLTVDRSTFLGNRAAWGGAVWFAGTTGRVTNSVFADNISSAPGAAIWANNAAGNFTLLNNTFTDAYKNAKEAVLVNGAATVQNNIFYDFQSGLTASGASAVVTEDYNLFAAVDVDPQALSGGVVNRGGHSRIAASPRFVNPAAANYRLQANSPAIDLGVNEAGVPTIDADGNPRPYGPTADIGAYEYQGPGIPSISIGKFGPPYVATGSEFRFILTVINEGTAQLDDLRISEQLPAGATYVAGSASDGGTLSGETLTWDLSPLAPNQSKRVEYKVTATQTLVSDSYSVSSISTPAITASGPAFTTPFDTNARAGGFFPYPDGFSFPNYTDVVEATDIETDDMVAIYGAGVCKTESPCVLRAAAEEVRKIKATTSMGGHCAGMAGASLAIFDRSDVNPGDFQPGASLTFDLTKPNARGLIAFYMSTQGDNPASTTGLPVTKNIYGARAIVDALLANYADPSPSDRYLLSLFDINGGSGHRVTPYAVVQQADPDQYWIYAYDNNYPNNFNRVFKVTYSTGAWEYEGGATSPSAPPSNYRDEDGSQPTHLALRSFRWADTFPKVCASACTPDATTTQAASQATVQALAAVEGAQTAPPSAYDFQLEGEGYLMVTRSDGLRAGVDPATGQFIAEIPGAEQISAEGGLGLNTPGIIHIPHVAGMTYALRIADRPNAYGNTSAPAGLNILGDGYVTRLKGLKIDSPTDPETATPGANDVVGVTFDGDNHQLTFQSSTLDSDTPSLAMAMSQASAPDYTFEVGGAQMPSGRSLSVAYDLATGKLVIENDDPADNTYSLDVERLNMDGSKTSYHFDAVSDGTGVGAIVDLGPSWTGGAPLITQNNGPMANADTYSTNLGVELVVVAPGVLANDIGTSPLTAVLVSDPSHGTLALNADGSFTYTPAAGYAGPDSFTYQAHSGLFDSNVTTVSITVNNAPVIAADQASVTVDEGQTAANSGTVSDADGDAVTVTASVGTVVNNGNGTWSWSFATTDGPAESQTVTITADDGQGGVRQAAFALTVNNVAPSVSVITAPLDPQPVGATVNASAAFTDPGTGDTHMATWEWGDGSTSAGTVSGGNVGPDGHAYATPGVYTVKLTVTDDDGGAGESVYQFVVVYDPTGGFVTGGGWITSPAGAYVADPALTGKATFGFESKYKKGISVPTGNTEFQFKVADLNFKSTSYEWLVVAGAHAKYKGVGTINGSGNYGFMLTATDGQISGGGGVDLFRIKIWDKNNGDAVVYDNQMGEGDDSNAGTPLGGGSIVIHQKK